MLKPARIPMMCECESLSREILPGSLLDDPVLLNTPENPWIKTAPVTHGSEQAPGLFGEAVETPTFPLDQ